MGWTYDWNDDQAICSHGNAVELDGNCWEVDCVNPVNGYRISDEKSNA